MELPARFPLLTPAEWASGGGVWRKEATQRAPLGGRWRTLAGPHAPAQLRAEEGGLQQALIVVQPASIPLA